MAPFFVVFIISIQAPHRLVDYTFTDCDIWYIRFAMDFPQLNYLSVGNKSGTIFIWQCSTLPIGQPRQLKTPHSQRAIRCVAFNSDATILIAACEDGTLFRWDQIPDKLTLQQEKQLMREKEEKRRKMATELEELMGPTEKSKGNSDITSAATSANDDTNATTKAQRGATPTPMDLS